MIAFAIGPIFAAFISLVTLPFVAWFFSAEDVGRLTMLQVALGLSVTVLSLQMHQAYVREYYEEKNKAKLFKISIMPGFIFLLTYLLICIVSPLSISKILFDIDSSALTIMLNISIVSMYFVNFFAHLVRMEERGIVFSISQVMPKVMLLTLVGVILLLNLSNSFKNLMTMNMLASVSSFFILAVLTRQTWIVSIKEELDIELIKKMLKFSFPLIAGGVAYWGLTTIDRVFLRHYSGFEELGIYAIAASLGGAVMVLSSIFANIWHPTVYKWVQQGVDTDKLQLVIETMLVFIAFIWSMFGLSSWLLKYLLPEKYSDVEYLVIACAAAPLLYMLSETTMVGIGIMRKSMYAMLASLLALLTSIFLNYLLIPKYGAFAAAIASMVSFLIFFLVRTESSGFLWVSLPRFKIYLVIFLYVFVTIFITFFGKDYEHFHYRLAWVALFFYTLLLHRASMLKLVSYFKKNKVF